MEEVAGTMEGATVTEGFVRLIIVGPPPLFVLGMGGKLLLVPMEDDARVGRRVVLLVVVVGLITTLGLGDCGC